RKKRNHLLLNDERQRGYKSVFFRAYGWDISFDQILSPRKKSVNFRDVKRLHIFEPNDFPECITIYLQNQRTLSINAIKVLPVREREKLVSMLNKAVQIWTK